MIRGRAQDMANIEHRGRSSQVITSWWYGLVSRFRVEKAVPVQQAAVRQEAHVAEVAHQVARVLHPPARLKGATGLVIASSPYSNH